MNTIAGSVLNFFTHFKNSSDTAPKSAGERAPVKLNKDDLADLWKMEIIWKDPKTLIDYEYNAKEHTQEQIDSLAAHFIEHGLDQPIVIDKRNVIVKGHGRKLGAIQAKLSSVPVVVRATETDLEIKAMREFDNKVAEGRIILPKLRVTLDHLDRHNFDLSRTGYKPLDLRKIMVPESNYEKKDEDIIPEPPVQVDTKPGDIFQLGENRLICGDSVKVETLEKLFDGNRANFCFTSPPYADQRDYGGVALDVGYLSVFLKTGAQYCDLFAVNLGIKRKDFEVVPYWDGYISAARNAGLKLLSWNVWNRQGSGYTIGQATALFPIEHEFIFILGRPRKLNPTIKNKTEKTHATITHQDGTRTDKGTKKTNPKRNLGTVIACKTEHRTGQGGHPATFPVELPVEYIKACSDKGEIIFDPFGGSGSTMIATEKTSRKCFMAEIEPKYCDVIIKRWENFTNKKAKKL